MIINISLQIDNSIQELLIYQRAIGIKRRWQSNLITDKTVIRMRRNCREKKSYTMYNETLYEVQRVIQIKWIKNRQFCLIKWKGYDQRFNTWEPKDHITFYYNYISPEERGSYREKLTDSPPATPNHHYHTRTKIRTKGIGDTARTHDLEEKEDNTYMGELDPENTPLEKWEEQDSEEENIKKKVIDMESWSKTQNKAVNRILTLNLQQGKQKRIGKVEFLDGNIAYMVEDVLKSRFPDKVIEFYERQMRERGLSQ